MAKAKSTLRKQSLKVKPRKSQSAIRRDPFENWKPEHRETARKSYLQYADHLAEGAGALHILEVALITACKALPATYSMTIPVSLGCNSGVASLAGGRGIDEAEELLVPVFSQLPLLLRKVRDAGDHIDSVVWRQVNCASEPPGMAAFVKENTRLPRILALQQEWSNEVWDAGSR